MMLHNKLLNQISRNGFVANEWTFGFVVFWHVVFQRGHNSEFHLGPVRNSNRDQYVKTIPWGAKSTLADLS